MQNEFNNKLVLGNAKDVLAQMPDNSVDMVVTSPPYWNAVEYDKTTAESSGSYEDYIDALLQVWKQCFRVLRARACPPLMESDYGFPLA